MWKAIGSVFVWALGALGALVIFLGSVPPAQVKQNFQDWFKAIESPSVLLNMIPGLNAVQLLGACLLALSIAGLMRRFLKGRSDA